MTGWIQNPDRSIQQILEDSARHAGGAPFGGIVLRGGAIHGEVYSGGLSAHSLFEIGSIRKSVAAALVAIAIAENALSLDQNAAAVWPALLSISGQEKDRVITLHHLLSSVSGWLAPDPPGVRFLYNNAAFTAAERVLARYLKIDDLAPLAVARLRNPIGAESWIMRHWTQAFDAADYQKPGPKLAIDSTLRDLARWGEFWLRGGAWRGQRLIPRQFAEQAARRTNPHLSDAPYGYCLYANDGGRLWPGVPSDAFGHGGLGAFANGDASRAYMWVCPSRDLVALTVGRDGVGLARAPAPGIPAPELLALFRGLAAL